MKKILALSLLVSFSALAEDGGCKNSCSVKKCVSACKEQGSILVCFYDLKKECGKHEFECRDSDKVDYKPRVVDLGRWDPRKPTEEWEKTYSY